MPGSRILLIVGGGIAAFKIPELVRLLKGAGIGVTTVLTEGGAQFVTPLTLSALSGEACHTALWDLTRETEMGHIQLSRNADLVVVAPATADLMAKINEKGDFNDDIDGQLKAGIEKFKATQSW